MHLRLKSAVLSCKKHAQIRKNRSITAVLRCIKFVVQVCVFEWCLSDGDMDIKNTVRRIIERYLKEITLLDI